MKFEIGDVFQHENTKNNCMIIGFKYGRVNLLSNIQNLFSEEFDSLEKNYSKVGHIDLSLLVGE